MRPYSSRLMLFLIGASPLLTPTFAAQYVSEDNVIPFPAVGEITVVFPRNETYAVEAPFPIVLGFHNAPALLSFGYDLHWTVDCAGATLGGGGYMMDDIVFPPGTRDYYYLNASHPLAKKDVEGDEFYYWKDRKYDICTLSWTYLVYSTCKEKDGGLEINTGYFPERNGSVEFKIRPGATEPRDAIAAYEGCAIAGTALGIAANLSNCAELSDDASPEPKPCALDVKGARSSLAAAVVTPTTSLTEIPTSTSTSAADKATGTTNSGDDGGSGGADGTDAAGSGDDEDAALTLLPNARVLTLGVLTTALSIAASFFW